MTLAPGGWRYAVPPALAAVPALIFSVGLSAALVALAVGVVAFFRDPDRTPPPTGVLSPADGKVSVIREEGDRLRVGVFMNVWNVHVNRAPMAGTVESVEHRPGAHRPAFSKESDRNERVWIEFGECEVSLIAGAFARRIHPYVEAGDAVSRGDRIGHIAFGSRADVLLPPDVDRADLAVEKGDKVTAGESVIAYSGDATPPVGGQTVLGVEDEADGVDPTGTDPDEEGGPA
ncbi:protein sorting system archaetidylserine decarboxylase [Halostella litorea]|uniref:protein sorting system archaetidylserine decarboxylase n=1 Tax=Halostella litorea TaxID=2528831 RepID=UPI0010930E43|nr:protein sorting system archaetidylserine decarboxylase [Halostella litorea]